MWQMKVPTADADATREKSQRRKVTGKKSAFIDDGISGSG